MKVLSTKELVSRLVNVRSKSPAHKANATRALKTYAVVRSLETGSTPSRIIAGIRSSVTRKIKK